MRLVIFSYSLILHSDSVCDILSSIVETSMSRKVRAKTFLMNVAEWMCLCCNHIPQFHHLICELTYRLGQLSNVIKSFAITIVNDSKAKERGYSIVEQLTRE